MNKQSFVKIFFYRLFCNNNFVLLLINFFKIHGRMDVELIKWWDYEYSYTGNCDHPKYKSLQNIFGYNNVRKLSISQNIEELKGLFYLVKAPFVYLCLL